MRKIYLLLWLTLAFSCQSDEIVETSDIVGIWYQTSLYENDLSFHNELIFNADGTYEQSTKIVETSNPDNVVGYMSLIVGNYVVMNGKLQQTNVEQFGLDDENPYLDRDALVFENASDTLPAIGLSIGASGKELILNFDEQPRVCPANIICTNEVTYYRD